MVSDPGSSKGAKFVLALWVAVNDSIVKAFKEITVPLLAEFDCWHGTVLLTDFQTGSCMIVTLLRDEKEAKALIWESGLFHKLLAAVGQIGISSPILEDYEIADEWRNN
eukprot:m51a1_g6008 hypothetical protein (109) ;mRNA; r:43566-44074